VRVSIDPDGMVVKEASTPAEIDRLKNEVAVLSVARHPGVVRLLRFDHERLETRLIDGATVGARSLSQEQVAAVGAALATTLADLHDIGIVHGAIEPSHVLIDGRGRPVLCGFGSGGTGAGPRDPRKGEDVAALAAMLTELRPEQRWPKPALRSAHALGAAWAASPKPRVRDKRHPGPTQVAHSRRRLAPMATLAAITLAAITLAAITLAAITLAIAAWWHPQRLSRPRFRIGEPTDQVVLGRWTCTATRLPAVLRLRTGTVWIWDHWPAPGGHIMGQEAAHVSGAEKAKVLGGPNSCDRLLVTQSGGGQTTLGPFASLDPRKSPSISGRLRESSRAPRARRSRLA
jgi:hypothetical protein